MVTKVPELESHLTELELRELILARTAEPEQWPAQKIGPA